MNEPFRSALEYPVGGQKEEGSFKRVGIGVALAGELLCR